ncbi:MAG: molybdopterin-dependent oxidoreductase [Candidatus Latescibacteria bacterium]|nr:molybdopterin-dependent oxidoreductase [Candidatus Latescibacterota bacterium]
MSTFTIDGSEIEIVPGKNVLQTAIDNGIYVPHYCYHPGLSAPANCRMCLVEMEMGGRRSLGPSCSAMPAEGMVVDTQSEVVKENQNAVMEFLLVNHPLDCPVCDQSGECELQDYSYTYGSDRSRYHEKKLVQPKKDVGRHVLLYSDRCIRCTRCIRFCDEISGTGELGYFNRGVYNEIDVFPGARMDNRLSGNTVDICPVGALLDKSFLFKQRVWFLKSVDTICPGCSTGCNIRADYNNERIYRLVPRQNPDVNEYWMCDDGRHGWGYVHADDRLLFPMLGKGEKQELALWEVALEAVSAGFERIRTEYGDSAVAGIASACLTNEELYLFGSLFRSGLAGGPVAVRHRVSDEGDVVFKSGFTIRADKSPNARGARTVLKGLGLSLAETADIWRGVTDGRIRGLYLVGGDPLESLSDEEQTALASLDFLVVQDVLSRGWTAMADVVLPGAAFIEKEGTFTNVDGRAQRIRQGLAPVGDARPDWEILRDVNRLMGGEAPPAGVEEIMADMSNTIAAFKGIDYDVIGNGGRPLVEIEAAGT